MTNKLKIVGEVVKALDGSQEGSETLPEGVVRVIATDKSFDRVGDAVQPDGVELDAYMRNPVVLLDHDRSKIIGKTISLKRNENQIEADILFDLGSELGAKTYGEVVRGFRHAVSIGFILKECELSEDNIDGLLMTKTELLEISFVTIPCNSNAIITAKELPDNIEGQVSEDVNETESDVSLEVDNTETVETKSLVSLLNADLAKEKNMTAQKNELDALKVAMKQIVADTVNEEVKAVKADFEKSFFAHTSSVVKSNKYDDAPAGFAFAKALPGMLQAIKGSSRSINQYVEDVKKLDNDFYVKYLGTDTTNGQGGHNTIPRPLAADIIPALYKRLAIAEAGATKIQMASGKLAMGRQNLKSTASYIGENTPITGNGPGYEPVILDSKKLVAFAPVSNEFLRHEGIVSNDVIFQDLMKAAAQAADIAFLRGAGGVAPTGIVTQLPAGQKFSYANAAPTLADFEAKLDDMELAVLDGNHYSNFKYIIGDRTFLKMRRQRDGGALVWPSLSDAVPTLNGYPVVRTNNLLSNVGTGTDEAEIFFGDFSAVLIGITTEMQLDISEHSQFRNDMTDIRLILEHDVKLRHTDAISYLTENWSK